MPTTRPLPLWAGRTAALLGILLVALNLRVAALAVSPIVGQIQEDIALGAVGLGVIAAVPTIAFSISAIFGATAARLLGLQRLLMIAIGVMVGGHLLRAVADNYVVLLIGTIISLLAAGVGNVVLPPLVKRYFPDRIGLLTGLYAVLLAVGASLPGAFAAPVATAAGWQISIGMWFLLAFASLVPWLIVAVRDRRTARGEPDAGELPAAQPAQLAGSVWRSPMAWTLAVIFALGSAQFYTIAAWFPSIMIDLTGASELQAGGYLAVFTLVGVPVALVAPALAARMHNVSWLLLTGISLMIAGLLGLMLAPDWSPVFWAIVLGVGGLTFPVSLTLINLRSRTQQGSVALSGFMQGVGYALAAVIPFLVGVLRDATGGWTIPLLLVLSTTLAGIIAAIKLRRPGYIEDDLVRRRD